MHVSRLRMLRRGAHHVACMRVGLCTCMQALFFVLLLSVLSRSVRPWLMCCSSGCLSVFSPFLCPFPLALLPLLFLVFVIACSSLPLIFLPVLCCALLYLILSLLLIVCCCVWLFVLPLPSLFSLSLFLVLSLSPSLSLSLSLSFLWPQQWRVRNRERPESAQGILVLDLSTCMFVVTVLFVIISLPGFGFRLIFFREDLVPGMILSWAG